MINPITAQAAPAFFLTIKTKNVLHIICTYKICSYYLESSLIYIV